MNLPNLMSGASEGELFIVHRSAVNQGAGGYGWHRLGGNPSGHYPYSDGILYDDFGSTVRKTTGTPSQPLDVFHLYDATSRSGEWTSRINGATHYTTASNAFSFPANPALAYTNNNFHFTGDIAEVLIYNRAVSVEERRAINGYLAEKYYIPCFDDVDSDDDGINDTNELIYGTDPLVADSNGDSITDFASIAIGLDPVSLDPDGDGLTNAQELALATNLFESDTDRDGVADNLDYYPLDPTRSQPPASTPGVPAITLTAPAGLTLQP